jgi:hypothetical protein
VRLKKTMGFPFPLDKGASLPAPSRRVFFPCVSIAPLFQRGERAATTSETSTQKISTVDSFIAYALLSFLPTAAYLSLQKKTCSEETSFCSSRFSASTFLCSYVNLSLFYGLQQKQRHTERYKKQQLLFQQLQHQKLPGVPC